MLKRLFIALMISAISLFALNFQTASKEELMSIKGIGEKKAEAIMKYRKSHKIRTIEDLKQVPGIGDVIADNAKRGIKNGDATKSIKRKAKKATSKTTKKSKDVAKRAKSVKKVAGDKTKRAEKKAKKSLKKVKEKAKKKSKK